MDKFYIYQAVETAKNFKGEYIEVTEEFFNQYRKAQNTYRQNMYRSNICNVDLKHAHMCIFDCYLCRFSKWNGYTVSENIEINGEEHSIFDIIPDEKNCEEDTVNAIAARDLLIEIEGVAPELVEVIVLQQNGFSMEEISMKLGIPRTTILSRLKSLRKKFEKKYKEFKDL